MNNELDTLFGYDARKFRETLTNDGINTANNSQLIAYMTMWAHSLEKSLSNGSFELGHSLDVVQYLVNSLKVYHQKDYDKSSLGYINTMSTLNQFLKRHRGSDFESQIKDILGDFIAEVEASRVAMGGAKTISIYSKQKNQQKNFAELSAGRYSVRYYANKPVDRQEITAVVELALKSPSVCNRQTIKVRAMYDQDVISKTLSIQKGMISFPVPPCLLLITAEDSLYLGANERNQGFIDGGLFSMSLLYALEYAGLAACPLNCMFDEVQEKSIRGLLDIPENEKLVMFVSCGHFKKINNVCRSFRYPVDYVLSEKTSVSDDYQIVSEPPTEAEKLIADIQAELAILQKPGVKQATRKLLGAVKRKIESTTFRQKIAELKNRVTDSPMAWRIRNRHKDGVTLTICVYNNYGNILQRFALIRFLANHGLNYDSFDMLDRQSEKAGIINHNFVLFAEKYANSVEFSKRNAKSYKSYIVGSDQVWRPEYLDNQKGGVDSFFLKFLGNSRVKRLAYAASFGFKDLSQNVNARQNLQSFRLELNRFDGISIREGSAKKIVNDLAGRKVVVEKVIDPTMLLEKEDYELLIQDADIEDDQAPVIFYFVFDNTPKYGKVLNNIQQTYNSQLSTGWPVNVEGWLKYIRDAKLVVAGSFHAVVFSIIFHTDFILMENLAEPNERVRNLLDLLGINQDRIVNSEDGFDVAKLTPIDWKKVDLVISEQRQLSGDWLLNKVRGNR